MLTVLVINSALAVDVSWPSSCAGQTGYDTSYPSMCPCTASGTFEVPAGVTTIPSNAFGHCTGITSVTGMSDVTTIDEAAFAYSGVQSIHWPSGATEIPKKAFDEARSLSKITGLDVVSSVGPWAFYAALELPHVYLPAGCTVGGEAFLGTGGHTVGTHAFYGTHIPPESPPPLRPEAMWTC